MNPPSGFKDKLPKYAQLCEHIRSIFLSISNKSGFSLIQTPSVERVEGLISSDSGDNQKLIFKIQKRQQSLIDSFNKIIESHKELKSQDSLCLDNLCDLGLRFDLTVMLMRYYESNKNEIGSVFKSIQIGQVFRAERPQKGRLREFTQADIDIIGMKSFIAEVEIIINMVKIFNKLGMHDIKVLINDRSIINMSLERLNIDKKFHKSIMITLDKYDKIGRQGIIDEIKNNNQISQKDALMIVDSIDNLFPNENISKIINMVNEFFNKEVCVFDKFLIRGMGYYTGTIFEIVSESVNYSIAGGGRYDGFSCKDHENLYACGMSIGIDRVAEILYTNNIAPKSIQNSEKMIAIIFDNSTDIEFLQSIINSNRSGMIKLRDLEFNNACISLFEKTKNISKQIDSLFNIGFNNCVIVKNNSIAKII